MKLSKERLLKVNRGLLLVVLVFTFLLELEPVSVMLDIVINITMVADLMVIPGLLFYLHYRQKAKEQGTLPSVVTYTQYVPVSKHSKSSILASLRSSLQRISNLLSRKSKDEGEFNNSQKESYLKNKETLSSRSLYSINTEQLEGYTTSYYDNSSIIQR